MLRYTLLTFIFSGIINYTIANKKYNWSIPAGKITQIFDFLKKKDQVEILRLYNSGQYEYLNYITQKNKPELIKRNLGTYVFNKHTLILNKPEFSEFQGLLKSKRNYFINNDLYERRIDCILKTKKIFFKKQTKKVYKKPFFIGFQSDVAVYNDSIRNAIKLKDLVGYLITDCKDDREKVLAIAKFICKSIKYDHDGCDFNKYAHHQSDIYGILMSHKRMAVCAGYAYVFDSLGKIANIETREVDGYTKQNYNAYGKLGGLHAWNIVKIAGKEYNIDVTWADGKDGFEMKWMFVEPEILILSHFPLEEKNNLYDKQFTENIFKDREVVLPTKEAVKLKHYPMKGLYKINSDYLTLKFKKNATIEVYWLDTEILENVYKGESKNKATKYYTLNKIENLHTYTKNDTFYMDIPINNVKTALDINVSDEYTIKLQVFKGDDKKFYLTKINEFNNQHVIAFTEGILAAIKLGNTQFLKSKLGDQYYILFDKKDRWKLNATIYKDILKWDGTTQDMTIVHGLSIRNGESFYYDEQYVNFNLNDKLYVKNENNKYTLVCIK